MSTLNFTLIQSDLIWEDKEANLKNFSDKLDQLTGKKQVVILPEMFNTGFSMRPKDLAEKMDGAVVNWMLEQASKHKIILCGSVMIEENKNYYNRMLWVQPNGEIAHYDKRHLFSYAGENEHFQAGQARVIVQVNQWRILLQICYDARFPVFARQQKSNEYDLIIYVANWPASRIDAWNTLLKARAIENQCFTIGVNRIGLDRHNNHHNGSSCVFNALGETLYQMLDKEDIFTLELNKDALMELRNKLPFLKDADTFSIN